MTYHSNLAKLVRIICVLLYLVLPANAQRLNEVYLHARADVIRGQYAEAVEKIFSIPAGERTTNMYQTVGESFYLAGKYSEAARNFAVADSVRANPHAQLFAARAYAMMQQPAKAVEWLQKYLSQRDKISESEIALDPAFEKIERSREWQALWNREWYNAADRRESEAAVLFRRNRYTDALAIIDTEIANRNSSARFFALRAKVYNAMEQHEPAHESAQTAIRMRNNSAEYFADAAKMAVNVKKYEIALDNINRAIRLEPYHLELYLQRAAILRLEQKFDDARNDVNFYFRFMPADNKALFQMGIAETEAGNPLTGIEYFNKLIDNDKTSPEYFIARANAHIISNDYTLAGDDLSQALDLDPRLPEAWHKKGVVLQQENNNEDACYYWRRALEMGHGEAAEYIYRYCIR